jgi:hypothetical protein
MDMLAYCRAMAAFCRQRAAFEDQNDAFWISREMGQIDIRVREPAIPNPNRTNGPKQERYG